ncbi:MAG: lipopolysaccharide heptosyltransferase I [Gammaproteobacteria bacterium]|nr:lipopolysaccharide heptosyltransferase I [Gammaproteobacteria bacterium]
MRVLLIKLTSMGDLLHVMPALSDLQAHLPGVEVDWLVEDSFAEVPTWHPLIKRVIPVATRRWRRPGRKHVGQIRDSWKRLRSERYDVVLDAQGLMKSALLARLVKLNQGGFRAGFSASSIKESPAARLYTSTADIARDQHAVPRLRQLFAQIFGYEIDTSTPDYQIQLGQNQARHCDSRSILLLHGTTWPSKHLPVSLWRQFATLAGNAGYDVKLFSSSEAEHERAMSIATTHANAAVLPPLSLNQVAHEINSAAACIAVDTGLAHIAAALATPCASIYGATDARLTGAVGGNQTLVQTNYPCSPCLLKRCDKIDHDSSDPPCYLTISPEKIWGALSQQLVAAG